ncbi:MAG TPA: hypothetical protein VF240_05960 [Pyrinomonadaceae bacterium]
MENLALIAEGLSVRTSGLADDDQPELRVRVRDAALLGECEAFLKFVAAYIERGARLRPDETLAYGYWLTKFSLADDGLLEVWEHEAGATAFVIGAQLTLTYWRDQHEVCRKFGGDFTPPRPDQLVVVSDGVFEGDTVQGVRYPSPEHMSGWWITTDRYDGNTDSLKREHLYHLTAARPDLARLIALPFGFRFDLAHHEDVWFDRQTLG